MNTRKPITTWNDTETVETEVAYRLTEDNPENKTAEELREEIYTDSFFWDIQRESFREYLTEIMQSRKGFTGFWKVEGRNMGWQNRQGYKYIKADSGEELLKAILPDTDCTVTVYRHARGLEMRVSHHDAPTGEWHVLKTIAKSTYQREAE